MLMSNAKLSVGRVTPPVVSLPTVAVCSAKMGWREVVAADSPLTGGRVGRRGVLGRRDGAGQADRRARGRQADDAPAQAQRVGPARDAAVQPALRLGLRRPLRCAVGVNPGEGARRRAAQGHRHLQDGWDGLQQLGIEHQARDLDDLVERERGDADHRLAVLHLLDGQHIPAVAVGVGVQDHQQARAGRRGRVDGDAQLHGLREDRAVRRHRIDGAQGHGLVGLGRAALQCGAEAGGVARDAQGPGFAQAAGRHREAHAIGTGEGAACRRPRWRPLVAAVPRPRRRRRRRPPGTPAGRRPGPLESFASPSLPPVSALWWPSDGVVGGAAL